MRRVCEGIAPPVVCFLISATGLVAIPSPSPIQSAQTPIQETEPIAPEVLLRPIDYVGVMEWFAEWSAVDEEGCPKPPPVPPFSIGDTDSEKTAIYSNIELPEIMPNPGTAQGADLRSIGEIGIDGGGIHLGDSFWERWQSDLESASDDPGPKCPKPSPVTPPIPPLIRSPEELRLEWESFREALESKYQQLLREAEGPEQASDIREKYRTGIFFYRRGIEDYRSLVEAGIGKEGKENR